MTNYECIMLGIEVGRICRTDAEVETNVDAMVSAGLVVAAEAVKIKLAAKRVALMIRTRNPLSNG